VDPFGVVHLLDSAGGVRGTGLLGFLWLLGLERRERGVAGKTGGGGGLGPARYDSGGVVRQVAGQSPNEGVAAGGGGGSCDRAAGDEEGGWGARASMSCAVVGLL